MQIQRQILAGWVVKVLSVLMISGWLEAANAAPGTTPPSTQTYYQLTTIDLNIPGSPGTVAYGINDEGLVCGAYPDAAWGMHGFLWQTGRVTYIDVPGWIDTYPWEVNNEGTVVGSYDDEVVSYAAVCSPTNRTWITLPDIPGKPVNGASGINEHGAVVGMAYEGTFSSFSNAVSWVWDGRAYSFFTVPGTNGPQETRANDINDQGQLCGLYLDSRGMKHGFIKAGEVITRFDVPGADDLWGCMINNEGEVAGSYIVGGLHHGFIMTAGGLTTFDVPGASQTLVAANNNRGDLVGFYFDASGKAHGFVAVPERLSIANTGTNLLLSWPVAAAKFQLRSTPSLSGNISWSAVPEPAVTNGNTVSVLVPASAGASHFRLKRSP